MQLFICKFRQAGWPAESHPQAATGSAWEGVSILGEAAARLRLVGHTISTRIGDGHKGAGTTELIVTAILPTIYDALGAGRR